MGGLTLVLLSYFENDRCRVCLVWQIAGAEDGKARLIDRLRSLPNVFVAPMTQSREQKLMTQVRVAITMILSVMPPKRVIV